MKNIKNILALLIIVCTVQACGLKSVGYNFTGGSVGDAKSFQVNFFQNYASQSAGSTVEPGLDRNFTNALQDLIGSQTSVSLTTSNGDLVYEGEIVEYRISPMTATAAQTAAQNRLTMTVNVRFYNKTKEDSDFEQRFSFFYDYPANSLLASVKAEAHAEIFERITQDIFSKSLADW
ncbi:MAG: LptE family protein [Cellulophaga sp.]|uniref:LptE family protein n=1 Tax=unclassified Cellulophaga TaxID=2634405 RepID=UPI000C2BA7A9|nr:MULTISPECIES: LptE family protein [unclassified Cellulophaga]MDO6491868.1 LptE family protein [Cellulophaga sp. 2_MG-2023]MDO6495477.1 LptE family protein [Cellulophaga sp. 3_MG-2023]PKB43213.1 lipopolysaccharide assembly protein [Cellulophaga sp. RHA19]